MSLKIAIGGKGGVGKTTIAALLARALSADRKVIAVDADPVSNLPYLLGVEDPDITPIAEMADLIKERTGARPEAIGSYFSLNPKVDDIPEKFSLTAEDIRVLVLGTIKNAGSGCICPASSLLKALMLHLVLGRDEVVIMDMEAGVEHLGRATATGVDVFLVVANPGRRSLAAAKQVYQLSRELKIKHVFCIANRIKDDDDLEMMREQLDGIEIIATIDELSEIERADRAGLMPYPQKAQIDPAFSGLATELLTL